MLSQGTGKSVAFSGNQTVYIVGRTEEGDDNQTVYWTVSPTGMASNLIPLTNISEDLRGANGVAFTPSGIGYLIGADDNEDPAYWTVSPEGVVSGSTALGVGGFAQGIAFSSSGEGDVTGIDGSGNACYWMIDVNGMVTGPFTLVGGEVGGNGTRNAVAVHSSGVAYIVGSTTGGVACYWTITSGIASSSMDLPGSGINSMGRGIAFSSSGSGIVVGQGGGNVACYWTISSNGLFGMLTPLPNGSGSGSSAYGTAFSSTDEVYIVGTDQDMFGVYWTLPTLEGTAERTTLDGGTFSLPLAIAISFPAPNPPTPPFPEPPTALTGRYEKNDFGVVYEYYALLSWVPSNSESITGYNIYKNGVKIATVSGVTTQFANHGQNRSQTVIYAVTAVDSLGLESSQAILFLN